MKIKEFDVKVDIKNKMDQEPFEVVQGDNNSNVLNISLVDGLEPFDLTGTEVDIVFEKADSTTVQQTDNAIVNESQGKIRCVLKTNTIACPGKVVAEVRVMESDVLLTSARFEFFVRGSLLNDKTIISTNEFPILSQLIVEANNLIERAEQIEERVPDAVMDALYGLSDSVLGLQNSIIGQIVNDPNKINNAAVIYSLAQQLSTLNNNFANLLFNQALPNVSGSYTTADDLPLGVVYCSSQLTNMPFANSIMITLGIAGLNRMQIALPFAPGGNTNIYKRIRTSGGLWQDWYVYNGSAL